MMHCTHCGAEFAEPFNFCPSCGVAAGTGDVLPERFEEIEETDASFGKLWGSYFSTPFDRFRNMVNRTELPGVSAIYVFLIGVASFILMFYISVLSTSSGRGARIQFELIWKFILIIAMATLFVALFMLLVNAIAQVPVNFGRNLLSASFAVTSILFMYSILFLIAMFSANRRMSLDPFSSFMGSFARGGGMMFMFNLGIILLFFFKAINAIIQGLRNSKTKDATAYYLAPFILCFGIYLGGYLAIEVLGK